MRVVFNRVLPLFLLPQIRLRTPRLRPLDELLVIFDVFQYVENFKLSFLLALVRDVVLEHLFYKALVNSAFLDISLVLVIRVL